MIMDLACLCLCIDGFVCEVHGSGLCVCVFGLFVSLRVVFVFACIWLVRL